MHKTAQLHSKNKHQHPRLNKPPPKQRFDFKYVSSARKLRLKKEKRGPKKATKTPRGWKRARALLRWMGMVRGGFENTRAGDDDEQRFCVSHLGMCDRYRVVEPSYLSSTAQTAPSIFDLPISALCFLVKGAPGSASPAFGKTNTTRARNNNINAKVKSRSTRCSAAGEQAGWWMGCSPGAV